MHLPFAPILQMLLTVGRHRLIHSGQHRSEHRMLCDAELTFRRYPSNESMVAKNTSSGACTPPKPSLNGPGGPNASTKSVEQSDDDEELVLLQPPVLRTNAMISAAWGRVSITHPGRAFHTACRSYRWSEHNALVRRRDGAHSLRNHGSKAGSAEAVSLLIFV